jgi:hypothetical protein
MARDILEQAQKLFRLYEGADLAYMDRRIIEETLGEYGVGYLQTGR